MNTRCILLGILYVAGTFNSFSNSIIMELPDDFIKIYSNSTSVENSLNSQKRSRDVNLDKPKICQLSIITDINNRYASTVVTSKVTNPIKTAQAYSFSFHVPINAFITSFVIEMNDKNYTSVVLEKEEANRQFKRTDSIRSPQNWESVQVRNTQKFSILVDLEALSTTTLYLTYEELLIRNQGQYEQVLNIFPGQVVEDLYVEIFLKETSKIIDLKIPNLRSGNEIQNQNKGLNPQAYISEDRESGDFVKVLFMPKEEEQKRFARIMETDENRGLAAQFVVQYDVENNEAFGEIVVSNGYFANFFAPRGLDPLAKHVIFVLDTSGSMSGIRIKQLKIAMNEMLNQLRKTDLMSLVEFNSEVKVCNLETLKTNTVNKNGELHDVTLPKPSLATPANIKKAVDWVNKFYADGGTDILSALRTGLKLVELGKKFDEIERQPLVMFLTDGEPSVGEKSIQRIKDMVTTFNWGLKRSPISTLGFGDATNQDFLHELALLNMGFFKHIYDAGDSQLQIADFFKTISVPVLANVHFKYDFPAIRNITITDFPLCYDGLELIVAGQYDVKQAFKQPMVEALSSKGLLKKQVSQNHNSATKLSNLWAFLTTKQLLNKIITNSRDHLKEDIKKILEVSLKYSFITPFTSMVVDTPDGKIVLGSADLTGQSDSKFSNSNADSLKYIGHG